MLIGDVVRSRETVGASRWHLQRHLEKTLDHLNERFSAEIPSRFTITLGDEFQGTLSSPEHVPEVVLDLFLAVRTKLRLGIGYGEVHTGLKERAIGSDGPAWHMARAALSDAKLVHRGVPCVFRSSDERSARIVTGCLASLAAWTEFLTVRQSEVLLALRQTGSLAAAASELGVTPQRVSAVARGKQMRSFDTLVESTKLLMEDLAR